MSLIITLIIFTVIVVVHEWGHFIMAKLCNVYIEEFAVGMGPKLFGFKHGDTMYSLRILPIGGYCRMADEKPQDSNKIGFNDASVYKRILIAVAGPFMNFILALALLTFLSMSTGIYTNTVESVLDGYPAQEAGIQPGDKIVGINGSSIHTRDDLNFYLSENEGTPLEVTVRRGSEKFTVTINTQADSDGQRQIIGITTGKKTPIIDLGLFDSGSAPDNYETAGFFECIADGFWQMLFLVKVTVIGVVRMFTLNVSLNDISGPIGVTTVVGEAYEETITSGSIYTILTMLNMSALLSANLGVINLVPIPALDGGRIFVYLIEIIRRKQLPPEKEGVINLIGFALVMGFGIFIAVNDVLKLM